MRTLQYHKYTPIACLYFFFNCPAFFPTGLLATSLLSPFFYLWLLQKRQRYVIEIFLLASAPFLFASMVDYGEIDLKVMGTSTLLLFTCYITAFAFAIAIREAHSLDYLIRTLIWLNLVLALVGLVVRFTPFYELMWISQSSITTGTTWIRFRGFTYEASYYGTLLAPLVLYATWSVVERRSRYTISLLIATLIPLWMTRSYSAFLGILIALIVVSFVRGKGLGRFKWIVITGGFLLVGYLALPAQNPLKVRAINVVTGNDGSEQIRTVESYLAAYRMATARDLWFGIGLGEIKLHGGQFMDWEKGLGTQTAQLPSAASETLGALGIMGLLLRFGLEGIFFLRTRPDRDPFRLSLFVWIFVFQLAGSFNGNLAEYVIWILAFSPSVGFFSKPREDMSTESAYGRTRSPMLNTAQGIRA